MKTTLTLLASILLLGCTENQRAKQFGGTSTIDLAQGQKLETVTWKENDLWVLTRPMKEGEQPVVHFFTEQSSWGIWEGEVRIVEH